MAKGNREKHKQCNGQRKNNKSTKNIMTKGKLQKDKEYNGQRKTTKVQQI